MSYDISKLTSRPLTEGERAAFQAGSKNAEIIQWYADQLWIEDPECPADPDAPNGKHGDGWRRPIVGEGIEIGPFEYSNDAANFNRDYSPLVARALGWGAGQDLKGKTRTKGKVKTRDGKFYLWVVRKL